MSGARPAGSAISSPTSRPVEREGEQRAVRGERPARLERREPGAVVELRARAHEHAVHPDRAAQRGEVRHRVGPGAGREAEAAVEQPVPDLGRDAVIAEPHDLDVVHLAERDVHRQRVRQRVGGRPGSGAGGSKGCT